jgi:Flp pilus assembly protein TadB
MTGFVLMGVPPTLAFMLFLINPEHMRTLTNSPLGMRMIYGAILMQLTGSLIIRKMVKLDY